MKLKSFDHMNCSLAQRLDVIGAEGLIAAASDVQDEYAKLEPGARTEVLGLLKRCDMAEVLEIPLDHLLDQENVRREMWNIRGADVEVPFYAFGKHKIWGATAMVLAELLAMIKGLSSTRGFGSERS